MGDEQESKMEDLTELLSAGALTNPSENALLKGDDVKGGDMTMTIRGFKKRRFDDGKKVETAWVMFFEEIDAGVKLNQSRQAQLLEVMGTNEMSNMVGRPITVGYDPDIKFGVKKVGGICLKRAEETLAL